MEFKKLQTIAKNLARHKNPFVYLDGLFLSVTNMDDDNDEDAFCHIYHSSDDSCNLDDIPHNVVIDPIRLNNFIKKFFDDRERYRKDKKIKPKDFIYGVEFVDLNESQIMIIIEGDDEIDSLNIDKYDSSNVSHKTFTSALNRYNGIAKEECHCVNLSINHALIMENPNGILEYYHVNVNGTDVPVPLTGPMLGSGKIDDLSIQVRETNIPILYQYSISITRDNIIGTHSCYVALDTTL